MDNTIFLEKYRSEDKNGIKSRIFSGRVRGEDVRKKSQIDTLVEKNGIVYINIPEDIFSITPSFLEELIINIVQKYGRLQAMNKLKFTGSYNIDTPLNNAIDNILLKQNGLN